MFMSWETQHRDEGSPYWTNYDPHCLQRHISTSLSEGVGQPFSPRTLLHTHLPLSRGPTQGTYRRELTAERLYPRCFLHLLVLSWETQHRAVCMPPAPYALTACNDTCQGRSSRPRSATMNGFFVRPAVFENI